MPLTPMYVWLPGKVLAEYENGAAVDSPTREYIYHGDTLLAIREGGAVKYLYGEHLSPRVVADAAGAKVGDHGHYPFGEAWYASGTATKWLFTSYERDSESSLDYAVFRYDASRLGRFLTRDPLAGSLWNPQSLNRYAYVLNDPTNLRDPLGLEFWIGSCECYTSEPSGQTVCTCYSSGVGGGGDRAPQPMRLDGPAGGRGPHGPGLKQTLACAAQNADNFDIAFLTGFEGVPVLGWLTGSAIGPTVKFLLNPTAETAQDAGGAAASTALTQTSAANKAVNAVGQLPVDSGFQTLLNAVPPTKFAQTAVGSVVTKVGGAAATGVQSLGKLPIIGFDASVFAFSFFLCGG